MKKYFKTKPYYKYPKGTKAYYKDAINIIGWTMKVELKIVGKEATKEELLDIIQGAIKTSNTALKGGAIYKEIIFPQEKDK